jgi:flagellar hook-length control protein FliK
MTSLPITPPASARGGTALKSSAPPPGTSGDFAALLNQTSARTAPAEGPKTRPAQPRREDRDAASGKDDKNAAAPDLQVAVPAPAPAPEQEKASADGTGGEAGPALAPEQPQGDAAPATVVPVPVADAAAVAAAALVGATAAPATAAQPAVVTPAPGGQSPANVVGQVAATSDGGQSPLAAAPADGAPAGKLQIPAELLQAKGEQAKDPKNGDQPKRDLPPAPTLPPTAGAAATPAPSPAAATPMPVADPGATAAPAPAPAFVTQAQPAATPLTAVPVADGGAGGLVLTRASVLQTAERVQELVRIATTRAGNARATLQLRPAELGQVDVHLRTTREGLVATISAHDRVGHDALQQAGNELRRSLEDKGVQLHSLDLQHGAGQHGFTAQGDAREASSGRRAAASTHGLGSGDDVVAEADLTITTATSTPAGALVDVQA